VVGFFEFRVELDGPQLVQDVEDLRHVHQHEGEVPGEDVRGADYVPGPRGEQHQALKLPVSLGSRQRCGGTEDEPAVHEEHPLLRTRGRVGEHEAHVGHLEEDVLGLLPVVAPWPPSLCKARLRLATGNIETYWKGCCR
jgi:hypothetical protein